MKRTVSVIVMLFVLFMTMCSGCTVVSNEEAKEFNSVLYDEKPSSVPMRFYFFRFMQDEEQIETRYIPLFDYESVASVTLEIINRNIPAIDLKCLECEVINGIAFVNIEKDFDALSDENKLLVMTSFVNTFGGVYGVNHVIIYAAGALTKLGCAQNVFLSPFRTDQKVTPLSLKEQILQYDELINVADDVAIPMLIWFNTKELVEVPTVVSIPFADNYINSIVSEIFTAGYYENYPFVANNKLLNPPVFDGENFTVNVMDIHENEINADAVLRTLRQYSAKLNIILKNHRSFAYGNKVEEIKYSSVSDEYGLLVEYFEPTEGAFLSSKVGIRVSNNNALYSVADYCLKNGIKRYIDTDAQLLHDVWIAKDHVCVSITRELLSLVEQMQPSEQRLLVYSLVNTMCKNFSVNRVKLLLDGYTFESIGVINTENTLNFI